MRWSFLLSLVLTLALAGVYWYQSGAHRCPVPLSYRLGTLDPSFGLSTEAVLAHIAAAEAIWEDSVDRDLFIYDPKASFTINFLFDERQATNNAEALERQRLDQEQVNNAAVIEEIEALEASYDSLVRQYEARTSAYERSLKTYNETVQHYNDQGGALPDTFAQLEAERQQLAEVRDALTREASTLNQLATKLAEASAAANVQINAYNDHVSAYNTKFGEAREFTQGDYQGDFINIYTFQDTVELERVLAHEFGHALGIGHVEGTTSIMYYLMTEQSAVPDLSGSDRAAFMTVCGSGDEWGQRVRAIIRNLIT